MSHTDSRVDRCLRWLAGRPPTARRLAAMAADAATAGLGPASINRHLSALRAHLRLTDPGGRWRDLTWPWQREPKGRTRTVSQADLSRLLAALPADVGRLVVFLAETGMRVSEALAATVEGGMAVLRTSKNGDPRRIPLTSAALAAHGAFPGQSRLNHCFRRAAAQAGLSGLRPHDLRHTLASRLVDAGTPLPVVAAWLGHRDHRSTLRYVHVSYEGLQRARAVLEGDDGPTSSPHTLYPPPR